MSGSRMDQDERHREELMILEALVQAMDRRDELFQVIEDSEDVDEAIRRVGQLLGVGTVGSRAVLDLQARRFTRVQRFSCRRTQVHVARRALSCPRAINIWLIFLASLPAFSAMKCVMNSTGERRPLADPLPHKAKSMKPPRAAGYPCRSRAAVSFGGLPSTVTMPSPLSML